MKYELFISDFDWTLGLAPDKIEPETVEAIKEYEKKGGIFVICTGRSYCSIKAVADKYGLGGLIVCFQGALGVDTRSNSTIFSGGMSKTDTIDMLTDLLSFGVETGVYIDDLFHYESSGLGIKEYERLVGFSGKKVDNLIEFVKNTPLQVRKCLAIMDSEKKKEVMQILSKKYDGRLIVNSSSTYFLEVVNPEWSKGRAVKRIAEYFNIPLSKVIAVGDSLNDKELVEGEWHGVVTGDGMEEVKPFAKEITVDFKDQPVKTLLEKYCL